MFFRGLNHATKLCSAADQHDAGRQVSATIRTPKLLLHGEK
jgi:hypothetical protein